MEMKDLQKLVNPIYTTAKGTAIMLAAGGDPDAIAMSPYLELDELQEGRSQVPKDIGRTYVVSQEARFNIYNNALLLRKEPNVVDLPSGYSPRGFRVANAKKRYFGFDLPAVIDLVKPAAEKTMTDEQKQYVKYATVDATNYDSLRSELGDIGGEVCVVTEGLLGYFNESELVSMCSAIHRLLSETGGCWMTADTGILHIYGYTYNVLFGRDPAAFEAMLKGKATGLADVDFYQNSLFLHGRDGAIDFLKKQGFAVQTESVSKYVHDLRTVPKDVGERLADKYSPMELWTMTVDRSAAKSASASDISLPFAVESSLTGGVFSATIQGRMDTITAPEVMKRFQEAGDAIRKIRIDVSRMAYISSAGLRVLLMMYKSLENKDDFAITGINEDVQEIMKTTGFDQFFMK